MTLLNRARMTTATTGTGTLTLGSAVSGYATFAEAGAANSTAYDYTIVDGTDFEMGTGTYTSSGTTFSRDTVTLSKISGTAGTSKINLSGSAQIFISPRAATLGLTGKHTIFMPAGAMIARTTNGAASGTTELTTNDVMLRTFDFDTTTEEGVGFWIGMPKSWNEGTVTFQAMWTAASGSGGVAWGLAAYSFSDDDAMDTAVSGQQVVTDTLITANDMHITAESSAITIGGTPAEGDAVYFELTREVANGSDTLGVDAKLIGVRLFFTTNGGNDA
jgi:hypothetical protein